MRKAQDRQLQYRRIYRVLAPCLRGSSCDLHNRRPVDILLPEFDEGFFSVVNGCARLPEMTRYHRLVKGKRGALLRRHQHTVAGAQGIAELDEAIRSLARYIHDCKRREVQTLENRNIHEGMFAFVGPYFDAGESGF